MLTSCQNGASDTGNDTGDTAGDGGIANSSSIILSGSFDGTTVNAKSLDKGDLSAASVGVVNGVFAIASDGLEITHALIYANDFSFSVPKDKPRLLVFLDGANIVGTYKVDAATDLDAFPLNAGSKDIGLGTVSLNAGTFTGGITQPALLNALGVDAALANAIGTVDDGALRLASLDADGNGLVDYFEGKRFAFIIHFEFDPGAFSDAVNTFSRKDQIAYDGYGFYLHVRPYDGSLDWQTGGFMNSPQDINGTNNKSSGPASTSAEGTSMDFYWDDLGMSPATPPAGSYIVNVPGVGGTAGKDYTFRNVKTQSIDANLYNIYIPTVKLTISNNRATQLELQWWKKLSDGTWVMPSDTELSLILHDASFEITPEPSTGDGILTDPLRSFTNPQTIALPSHDFEPGSIRMIYTDKFGFVYGFTWSIY